MEGAFQGIAATLQAESFLGGSEHDSRCRANFGPFDLNIIAAADTGIDALEAIEAKDVEPLVLRIRADHQSRRVAFAEDFDSLSLLKNQRCECLMAHPSYAASCIAKGSIRDLETYRLPNFCHCCRPIGELSGHEVASTTMSALCRFSCVLQVRKSGPGFGKKSAGQTPHFLPTACSLVEICSWFEGSLNRSLQPQVKRYGRVSWWPRLLLFASPTRLNSTPIRMDD
jgi:hypothetical protein